MSFAEIIFILILAILLFKPDDMQKSMRIIGRVIMRIRDFLDSCHKSIEKEGLDSLFEVNKKTTKNIITNSEYNPMVSSKNKEQNKNFSQRNKM